MIQEMQPRQRSDKSVDVLLGPVVGRVTTTTARILVEYASDTSGKMLVTSSFGETLRFTQNFKSEVPSVFKLENLQPGCQYRYVIQGTTKEGSFSTLSDQQHSMKVIVCSCDKPVQRGSTDMFQKMYDQYIREGNVDLIVRNGDQVYADHAFYECERIWKKGHNAEVKESDMLRAYQQVYRDTWNKTWVAKCYANASHIMLLDDHEIRNDWGTFKHDDDTSHRIYVCGLVGRKAYYLYQRQLWDDINVDDLMKNNYTPNPNTESTLVELNGTGILLVDCRGGRSWGRIPQDKNSTKAWLGENQWQYIRSSLKETTVNSLIVVHSTPPVYLGSKSSKCLSCIPALVDKMGFGLHTHEQAEYLDLFHSWKSEKANRKVTLVGGDLHYHLGSKVFKDNIEDGFRQIVASPVSNSPPPCCARWLIRCFMCRPCGPAKVGGGWKIRHDSIDYDRNFVLLESYANSNQADMKIFVVTPTSKLTDPPLS
eukprot:TRINITY_DN11339_c2_g1_i1.p1 TRINITY_DN11339_c2_g1~~TRINITY_DN11339_c2_g1_i1.p1  ORF type:complete len:482 (+),score=65.56 TRINITY_DN11339_c2_g1_i1:112-1557(+)